MNEVQLHNEYIHKIKLPFGQTVCGIKFGTWLAGSLTWSAVTCLCCLKRKGWKLVKVQKSLEELETKITKRIDERRRLALQFEPETKERKFLEGMITGLDLALTEFLISFGKKK